MADPMEWETIEQRIEAGEDERTEFKRWSGNLNGILRAVCALANSSGGLVLIGVADDGGLMGVLEEDL